MEAATEELGLGVFMQMLSAKSALQELTAKIHNFASYLIFGNEGRKADFFSSVTVGCDGRACFVVFLWSVTMGTLRVWAL